MPWSFCRQPFLANLLQFSLHEKSALCQPLGSLVKTRPSLFPKLLIISLLNKQLFGLEMVKLAHLKGDVLHRLDLVVHSFHIAVALREINAVASTLNRFL